MIRQYQDPVINVLFIKFTNYLPCDLDYVYEEFVQMGILKDESEGSAP